MTSILRHIFFMAAIATPAFAAPALSPLQQPSSHAAELAALRRQPRDLLEGIMLSKAEKKAIYAIVRRNASGVRALELRDNAAIKRGTIDSQLEPDLVGLRDRERVELRAVLTVQHRHRFDRNLDARLHLASTEQGATNRSHGALPR